MKNTAVLIFVILTICMSLYGKSEKDFLIKQALNQYEEMPGIEEIRDLLKKGVNTKSKNILHIDGVHFNKGTNPLMISVYFGYTDLFKALLNNKNIKISKTDDSGNTVLFDAAGKGSRETINMFIEKKLNVNSKNKEGETPLMYALWHGNYEGVKTLLENGADVRLKDNTDHSVMHYISASTDTNSINLLIAEGAEPDTPAKTCGQTPIMTSAISGNTEALKILLQHISDIDSQDKNGATALMYASQNDFKEITDILIANKANINLADNSGNTALMYAVIKRKYEVAKFLISKGAYVNVQNNGGHSVYGLFEMYADYEHISENSEIINMLKGMSSELEECIEKYNSHIGVDEISELLKTEVNSATDSAQIIYPKDFFDGEPLYKGNYDNILKGILDNGGVYEALNEDYIVIPKGYTPLMIASMFGYTDIAYELIKIGAGVNLSKSEYGHTPLMIASFYGNYSIADMLISKGADINAIDINRKTALDYAKEQDNEDIINILTEAGAK